MNTEDAFPDYGTGGGEAGFARQFYRIITTLTIVGVCQNIPVPSFSGTLSQNQGLPPSKFHGGKVMPC